MISSTNNKSNQSETFAHLYEVLLYKRKDIIAIQEKLGIYSNTLKQIKHESDGKTLADSYKLLLHLVGDLILIQKNLDIDGNPILAVEYNNVSNQNNRGSSNLSLSKLFSLLLYLEDDIVTIQEKIGIVGYTNQEMAEEADKNTRVYLRKFEEFHGPLEDIPSVLIQKFIDSGVKMFYFTGEGLSLFPNVTLQQLHEIFIKKSANNNQCPCLESKVKKEKLSQIYICHSK
ncbi:4541_t:CDS:1 [Ambispora leptoticha]|uniref:4541_t:CDS:1 n=1 Tax=Ambispora leptoticha TaxID=144679 RepID=A0A9N9F9E7_9GLOM|nr:4541_t:CDS:1 [Ambispora leptoticha]